MRLIDEYLCRNAEDKLVVPCGVCLYRSDTGTSVVMTVTNVYGKREHFNVRFFDVETPKDEPVLLEEKVVSRSKIFDPETMNGDRFQVMEFAGADFPDGPPVGDDMESALIEDFYNNLYYGEFHKDERTIFLRMAYYSNHLTKSKRKRDSKDERAIASWRSKLHFDTSMPIAPEILFSPTFPKKEKPISKLDHVIKSMGAMTFNLDMFAIPEFTSSFESMGFSYSG